MLASAPGKVLILGGYLIVQSPNVGISIGVNARFTTTVTKAVPSTDKAVTTIHIVSPQFKQEFAFSCHTAAAPEEVVKVTQTQGPSSPFLYYAVLYSIAGARIHNADVAHELWLELRADNDFYSQRNYLEQNHMAVTVENLRKLPKQLPLVGEVSKTGLGSSAAMTTSVVACLLNQLAPTTEVAVEFVHRVAQIAHSVSQGKIGSGFDVFTAVYGTCAYRRFPAKSVEAIMKDGEKPESCQVALLNGIIDMKNEWVTFKPFRLPKGFHLVLGDVHFGGSSTPGMVAKIMAWQKTVAAEEGNLWEKLRQNNESYIEHLTGLNTAAAEESAAYQAAIDALKAVPLQQHTSDLPAEKRILEASRVAARSRQYLREMGHAAAVKVEPEELTELLNDTAALPGVFAVGCPGAGGYDAVFALVLGDEANCRTVEQYWESYTKLNICPLLVREDPSGLIVKSQ